MKTHKTNRCTESTTNCCLTAAVKRMFKAPAANRTLTNKTVIELIRSVRYFAWLQGYTTQVAASNDPTLAPKEQLWELFKNNDCKCQRRLDN